MEAQVVEQHYQPQVMDQGGQLVVAAGALDPQAQPAHLPDIVGAEIVHVPAPESAYQQQAYHENCDVTGEITCYCPFRPVFSEEERSSIYAAAAHLWEKNKDSARRQLEIQKAGEGEPVDSKRNKKRIKREAYALADAARKESGQPGDAAEAGTVLPENTEPLCPGRVWHMQSSDSPPWPAVTLNVRMPAVPVMDPTTTPEAPADGWYQEHQVGLIVNQTPLATAHKVGLTIILEAVGELMHVDASEYMRRVGIILQSLPPSVRSLAFDLRWGPNMPALGLSDARGPLATRLGLPKQMPQLQELEIVTASEMNPIELANVLKEFGGQDSKLERIGLAQRMPPCVDADFFKKLRISFPNLRFANVEAFASGPGGIVDLARPCIGFLAAEVTGLQIAFGDGGAGLALKSLVARGCRALAFSDCSGLKSLKDNLRGVRALDLSCCGDSWSPDFWEWITMHAETLESLAMPHGAHGTMDGKLALECLARIGNLTALDVSSMDAGPAALDFLNGLAYTCPNLQYAELPGGTTAPASMQQVLAAGRHRRRARPRPSQDPHGDNQLRETAARVAAQLEDPSRTRQHATLY
eukprot:tig00001003_g6274.t1